MEKELETLKMKIRIANDDLKDAKMYISYAEDARELGDKEFAASLHRRAKGRLTHFDEANRMIEDHLKRLEAGDRSGSESMHAKCLNMMLEEQEERAEKLKKEIDTFAA